MLNKLPKINLFQATLLAGLMAGLGNLLLFYFLKLIGIEISVPAGQTSLPLLPLTLGKVLFASIAPALGAGIIFAIVRKFPARNIRSFFILSIGLLIFSFGAPLGLPQPPAAKIGLILMHIVAALFIWGLCTIFKNRQNNWLHLTKIRFCAILSILFFTLPKSWLSRLVPLQCLQCGLAGKRVTFFIL